MQKSILILLVLLVAGGIQAQTKSPTRKKTRTTETKRLTSATLSIEAAVIYESGDVKPVARTTFVLLDEDLNTLLKPFPRLGSNLEKADPITPRWLGFEIERMQFETSALAMKQPDAITEERAAEIQAEVEEIKKTIAAHTVASVTTDFSGKAVFEGVAPGERFIYGRFKAGRNEVSWHMRIEVKTGSNAALTLSNDNSLNR